MAAQTTSDVETGMQDLADGFIRAKYARLAKDYETPLPPLTDEATSGLRAELEHALSTMNMLGRAELQDFDFTLEEMNIDDSKSPTIKVTCYERYQLTYVTTEGTTQAASGVRHHRFAIIEGAGGASIDSHGTEDVAAHEIEAAIARREASGAIAEVARRRPPKADATTPRQAEKPAKPAMASRDKIRGIAAGVVLLAVAAGVLYFNAPVSSETSYSLHTGLRRTTETQLGKSTVTYTTTPTSDWAKDRISVAEADQMWVSMATTRAGWFGLGSEAAAGHPWVASAELNLKALRNLDAKDRGACDAAIKRYLDLVKTADPELRIVVPRSAEEAKNLPPVDNNSPFMAFHRTILR